MFPAILKTNTLGYDGKGQIRVNNIDELNDAFVKLNQVPCILEKMVNLKREVSIMVARNEGEVASYPVVENIHINGILDTSTVPAAIDNNSVSHIEHAARCIIEKLDYIGILGIEFFITEDNEILANEMAPRPHNSGHYTLDACMTSQFEQQVRAICNLKLGSTQLLSNAIMLNLLGDVWPQKTENVHPAWDTILTKYANVKLHLYDKTQARNGRKMGHLTILGDDITKLQEQINEIKILLGKI
jgi:5-(carboxyamino)imidazole ribonucleotide synthase